MTSLDYAIEYANLGWRVAPIPAGLKHPGAGNWQDRATTDHDQITAWYTTPGAWRTGDTPDDYGVCIATGPDSGVFVLDIDPAHGGDDTLADLEHEHGPLPDTVECVTGGGGRHLYFTTPAGVDITNADTMFGPGVDVRGRGGQVVAPPTIHPTTGNRYEWEASSDPLGGHEVADAPDWLIRLLTEHPTVQPRRQTGRTTNTALDLDRPGDRFEADTDWSELLITDGWRPHSTRNGRAGAYELWTRPGKDPREGASASLYYMGSDVLKVFTPNAPGLTSGDTYTRFGYYAATRHHGDHAAAARTLRAEQRPPPTENTTLPTLPTLPAAPIASTDTWLTTAPTPLGEAKGRPPFPIGVLPHWISEQVRQVAAELQMTNDLPALLAITALSTVAAGRIDVAVNTGTWREPLNTYIVSALPPGAGKSPAFKAMIGPLEDHEADLIQAAVGKQQEWVHRRDMVEARLAKAKKADDFTGVMMAQDELNELGEVVIPRLMVEDITPEKLAIKLAEQDGRLALVSAEGGLFTMIAGRYSDKSNLDVYLSAWSRDIIRQDRVGRPDIVVRNPTLTIGVTVQPSVIADLAKTPELQGRGLVARFMFSIPPDSVGLRNLGRESTWVEHVAAVYGRTLLGLEDQCRRDFDDNEGIPVVLRLSPEARAMFLAWRQRHEHRLGPDGDLRYMAEWVTKLQSTTVRIAGLLHLADHNGPHRPVSESTMGDAIRIGDYFEAHARIAHDLWGSDPTQAQARSVIEWIRRREARPAIVSASEIQQGCRRVFGRIDDTRDALVLLVELGWLRPLFEGPIDPRSRGGKSPDFAVHPDVWTLDDDAETPPTPVDIPVDKLEPSRSVVVRPQGDLTDSGETVLDPTTLRQDALYAGVDDVGLI